LNLALLSFQYGSVDFIQPIRSLSTLPNEIAFWIILGVLPFSQYYPYGIIFLSKTYDDIGTCEKLAPFAFCILPDLFLQVVFFAYPFKPNVIMNRFIKNFPISLKSGEPSSEITEKEFILDNMKYQFEE